MRGGLEAKARPGCGCCGGRGIVPAASGEMRPCSRCRRDACDRWFHERRPEPARTRMLRRHDEFLAQYRRGGPAA